MDTIIYQPYVYRWTNISNNRWYVGSRTARFCHPTDGYICSSKIVKELIRKNPSIWRREILYVGTTKEEVILKEHYILTALNAKHNPNSYNMTNGDRNFVFKAHTDSSKAKLSESHKGKSTHNKGKKHSPETLKKISEALKKRYANPLTPQWNKGLKLDNRRKPK